MVLQMSIIGILIYSLIILSKAFKQNNSTDVDRNTVINVRFLILFITIQALLIMLMGLNVLYVLFDQNSWSSILVNTTFQITACTRDMIFLYILREILQKIGQQWELERARKKERYSRELSNYFDSSDDENRDFQNDLLENTTSIGSEFVKDPENEDQLKVSRET